MDGSEKIDRPQRGLHAAGQGVEGGQQLAPGLAGHLRQRLALQLQIGQHALAIGVDLRRIAVGRH